MLIERPNNLNDALKLFANNSGLIWQRCAKQNHIEQTVSLDCIKQLGTNYHYLMALTEASTFLVDRCNILPKDNKFKTKDMIEHIKSDIRNLIQSLPKKDSLKFRHGILMSHLAVAMTKKMMNQGLPMVTSACKPVSDKKTWACLVSKSFVRNQKLKFLSGTILSENGVNSQHQVLS